MGSYDHRIAVSQNYQTLLKLIEALVDLIRPFTGFRGTKQTPEKEALAKQMASAAEALLKFADLSFENKEQGARLKKHKLFKRYENFKKLIKDYTNVKDFDDAVKVIEKHQTQAQSAAQKFMEYARETLYLVKYFDSDVEDTMKIEDYTVTLVSSQGKEIDRDDVQKLYEVLKRTNALLNKAGLGSSTGGRLFAYKGQTLGGAGGSASGAASYNISTDLIKVALDDSVRELVHALVHELGHRVYYRSLSSNGRAAWEEFFGENVGLPDVDTILSDWDKWRKVSKPREYRDFLGYYLRHLKDTGDEQTVMMLNLIASKVGIDEDFDPMTGRPKGKNPISGYDQLKAKKQEAKVFLYPVSAYSGKNPEELFAEVLAYVLVDGPQRVEPLVREVFRRAVPALRLAHRVVERYLGA